MEFYQVRRLLHPCLCTFHLPPLEVFKPVEVTTTVDTYRTEAGQWIIWYALYISLVLICSIFVALNMGCCSIHFHETCKLQRHTTFMSYPFIQQRPFHWIPVFYYA